MKKSVFLYLLICMMGCCAESLKANNVYLQKTIELDFSMADEWFKPEVPIKSQVRRPSSQLNWSVRANTITVADKKERYAYKSIGAGVLVGESALTSYGKVNENAYLAQSPAMGICKLEGPLMDELMLMASPPPGGGAGTGELVSIDNEIPVLLLLLLGYCVWLWKGKKTFK